ncbi:rho guanine nucleotide exchange factor 18a [Mugil cephalus]|uniref:rho guanine nucleotide exchange factor 18a n=1 Tax=Mugil cephalus TaxID=48193 RepID=UPI001FB79DA7|nr:rho guanine nucleotide exchange factor 18a [Mugil cephalus]XP_047446648.1 rho guanine nucleotide exchange factor 18a [Mugil cephalus]XP_047446650.1 rho guanine nucleotide exchange factor 18a [Mugil cephalus]XP_047446651.1 rho guanine nucleotide exchange factor 18a [Mugil cephalus]
MTVTPSSEPTSSSHTDTRPRSGLAQMDEIDGLRLRLGSEDSLLPASSSSSLAEPINLEDAYYTLLREELESDAQNLEAESWSLAVDQNYLNALSKEAIKRQDVIYELIKTEMHHVRTLKILLHVYVHELKHSLLIEDAKLKQLFAGVEDLLSHHQYFLNNLKARQSQSQEEGSPNNYYITQLGDILKSQFSGTLGEGMIASYSVFCSRHNDGITFFKEQSLSNKKLQFLIRKIGQLPLVRRLGIPECFLLLTQRITKYPVLVERIIQNTDADTEEHRSLEEGLKLIKDTISQVNDRVSEYEKAARLKDIIARLDPKMKDGGHFRKEDLNQGYRLLLHEGTVTWKSSGKQKDVQAVLLSDTLLLLQEKDQKLLFATMDNKPPVISLERLIVREVAHEDKAMYLICASTTSMPEMYEIHTGSKEERVAWTNIIRMAVDRLREEQEYMEEVRVMQNYQDNLKLRDDLIRQNLQEKLQIFAHMYDNLMEHQIDHKSLLLRGTAADLQQGEALLNGAINEVENLQNLLLMRIKDPGLLSDESKMEEVPLRRAETFGVTDKPPVAGTMKNGDGGQRGSEGVDFPLYRSHSSSSDDQQQDTSCSDGLEQSADDETDTLQNSNRSHFPEEEVCDRVIMLAQRLYSLQAVVAQQDSLIEMQHVFHSKSKQPPRHYNNLLLEQERQRNVKKQEEELAHLHKLQAQHREEQQRWEKEKERQRIELETLKAELQRREEDCRKAAEELSQEKAEHERQKEEYQQNLETLKKSTNAVEKEKEQLAKEKERVEKLRLKLGQGYSNYDNPAQSWSLSSNPSFRGSILNGGGSRPTSSLSYILPSSPSNPMDIPPKVPPRRESINVKPVKSELPAHLISATNQVHKVPPVQQKIPDKLATKGKEKGSKVKKSHQRTHSAAYLDVDQLVPIRVTGKEGGSLKSSRKTSPQRIYHEDIFKSPGSTRSVKSSQSTTKRNSSSDTSPHPPPTPPPFPADVIKKEKKEKREKKDSSEKGKEKVIFF